ncbi:MAG TPA: cation diffusion facilitator family transporter [Novosphingobium sp.]|nr:cation diffusion facilitator family transporter [Novosphingobium sp.]
MSTCGCGSVEAQTREQRRVLTIALALNLAMFFVEGAGGWIAGSSALIADALDMLADASAYAIALLAIGRSGLFKARAAGINGVVLLVLGLGVLADVVLRYLAGEPPAGLTMIAIAALALGVNAYVLRLLAPQRDGEVHLRATWLITRADVIANAGVIAAGLVVLATGWREADLVVGAAIGVYVIWEALGILREAREAEAG